MITNRIRTPFLLLVVIAAQLGLRAGDLTAQSGAPLGAVSFESTGGPDVRAAFQRGVLLLHNFEYDDARAAFREVRRLDPNFVLAYWGEALTHDHPLWGDEDLAAAREVLAGLGPSVESRLARARTVRERDYLHAVEQLFGEGSKAERDQRYAAAMREMVDRYPDDEDAAALYALSLLATAEDGRDFGIYMRAAAVLEEWIDEYPRHPGVLHYMIHAYDDPVHAPLGLRAARRYGDVAAGAVHALHMPSHIFFALGMWSDAIRMNERSWQASVDRAERLGLGPASWSYHALWWLHYAYLQEGRFTDARRLLEVARQALAESGAGTVAYHLTQMRAAHVVADPSAMDLVEEGLSPETSSDRGRAASLAAAGHALMTAGRWPEARGVVERVRAIARESSSSIPEPLALQLEGRLLLHDGDREAGLDRLREAARMEYALPYEFGPPLIAKPGWEVLGEELARLGDRAGAEEAFVTGLRRAPGRRLMVRGLEAVGVDDGRMEEPWVGRP